MNRRNFLSLSLLPVLAVVPAVAIAAENPIDVLLRRFLQVALGHYEATGVVLSPVSQWSLKPIPGLIAGNLRYELRLKDYRSSRESYYKSMMKTGCA